MSLILAQPSRPSDRLGAWLAEPTARRLTMLVAFGLAVWGLQALLLCALAAVGVFDLLVGIERVLMRRCPGWPRRRHIIVSVLLLALLVTGVVVAGAGHVVESVRTAWGHLPTLLAQATSSPLWQRVATLVPPLATLSESAREFASKHARTGLLAAGTVARALIMMVVGAIVAVVYFGERDEVDVLRRGLVSTGPTAMLWRWFAYLAEGLSVMLRTQVAVATVNAALTLPLLALLRLPELPMLTVLVFLGSLLPVVGNALVGAVLACIAGSVHGLSGVVALVISTAVLHKVESYWINPRLAAAALHLPSIVIIGSLLVTEHALGLRGLLMALPCLVVAVRLREEFRVAGLTLAAAVGSDVAEGDVAG